MWLDFLQTKAPHFSPSSVKYHLPTLDIPIPGAKVRSTERELKAFLGLSDFVLRPACFRNVSRDRTHTQHSPGFGVLDKKVLVRYRDRVFGLPISEVGFTFPVTLLRHSF